MLASINMFIVTILTVFVEIIVKNIQVFFMF